MSESAISSNGIVVEWSPNDGTYYAIGQIQDAELPGPEADEIEVSDHSSRYKMFKGGMIDNGTFSCELLLLPNDTQHKALRDTYPGEVIYLHVTLPAAVTTYNQAQFRGVLKKFGPIATPMSGVVTAPLEVKVSGSVTWATAT